MKKRMLSILLCLCMVLTLFPVTVFAEETYTVTFDANGGSGSMDAVTVVSGDSYTLPGCTFTAPIGKQFKGWAASENGEVISDTSIAVTKDITLYAIWEDIPVTTYTVSFNANGGSVTLTSATTGADGKLAPLPTPTRSGYRFDGWYTAVIGGDKITKDTVFTADTTVYAHWTKKTTSGPSGSGSNTGTVSSPQTGDNSSLTVWFALLAVLAAGVMGAGVYSNRRRSSR